MKSRPLKRKVKPPKKTRKKQLLDDDVEDWMTGQPAENGKSE